MNEWIYSAHDLCVTRLCQAANCENDAMPGWPVCERHDRMHKRGIRVTLHEVTQPEAPIDVPELRCSNCKQFKPDEDFSRRSYKYRRGRHMECRACNNARRKAARAAFTPEQRAAETARNRSRKARQRQANA